MIRVVLCDDHDVVRAGLRNILAETSNVDVVGEAADGREAIEMVARLLPDVVVMDISMPGLNGLEATRRIRAEHPEVRVVSLSMHSDRQFVMETLKAGAAGYLLKSCVGEELVPALHAIADGRTYLSSHVAMIVVDDYVRHVPADEEAVTSILSPRERDVLQLLAEGKTSKEIAQALHVSPKTVESHRGQIMDKLNLRTVAELTKLAVREGLTSLEC